MAFSKSLRFAFVLTGLLGTAATAHAETQWEKTHPRRVEVNHRLANENARINTERKDGEITGAKAARLHQDDRVIRSEQRGMASMDGGHLTKADQAALNQQENHVSRQVGQ